MTCSIAFGVQPGATLGSGEFFGEMAVLEPVKRTATVTAASRLRFFIVSGQAFRSVRETDPAIERRILRTLARRLLSQTGDPQTP